MSDAMQSADEILEQAKKLPPEERRHIAEELLADLDHGEAGETPVPGEGPYAQWLAAAGSVRSDHTDLSTEKYEHVAAATLDGHDEA